MEKILEISDLGKSYKLGETKLLSSSQFLWALKEINFSLHKGEVLGIIGKNGAGKSTLLKLLTRISEPTEGRIKAKGKISGLLEVGTGMHPDLTGRENVYLNGAILGMSKAEIASKFDDIVAFAEIGKFIDTPIKRYSSGMKVRLGFSVAAFLNPDIVIIDEVLAVGDQAFQAKAVAKILDMSSQAGKTVIFVSHNLNAIKTLCTRCILLKEGRVHYDGEVDKAISLYLGYDLEKVENVRIWEASTAPGNANFKVLKASLKAEDSSAEILDPRQSLEFSLTLMAETEASRLDCTLQLFSEDGIFIAAVSTVNLPNELMNIEKRKRIFGLKIPPDIFNRGIYKLTVLIVEDRKSVALRLNGVFALKFAAIARDKNAWLGDTNSLLLPEMDWKISGE